jgi:hypothetical protein
MGIAAYLGRALGVTTANIDCNFFHWQTIELRNDRMTSFMDGRATRITVVHIYIVLHFCPIGSMAVC